MSARAVLELARQNGVHVAVEGTELILNSDHEPPLELLDQLRCHKAEIIAYIAPSNDGWAATAWRAFFEERLATAESDVGRPRAKAAAKAFDACVPKFTDRYPAPSKPGQCAYCGALEAPGCSVILPRPNGISDRRPRRPAARFPACSRARCSRS